MREPVELRRRRILAVVDSRGSVRIADLADELEVSVVTLRRDVEELARQGKLRRGHGVARSAAPTKETVAATRPERLRAGEGDTIGLVVPERHAYLFEALHGARTVLEEAGLRVALHITPQAGGGERPMVERALASGVRGLVIAPRWRAVATEEADYGWLGSLEVPAVLMERRPRRGGALHAMDSVCSDHWYGIHLALDHLVSLGHRRIVLAARDDSPTARALRAAFTESAAARPEVTDWAVTLSSPDAVPEPPGAPTAGAPTAGAQTAGAQTSAGETQGGKPHGTPGARPAAGSAAALAELLRERGATAAVLHGDVDALMLVQHLQEAGIRVPEDCSVVAYDDVVAALGSTPLTAVAPPKAEVGRTAAELLLRRLREPAGAPPEPVRRIELLPELKIRGSAVELSPAPAAPE